MLIGKASVDKAKLLASLKTVDKFIAFSDSLVPEEFRHVQAILSNQRYICCLLLRKEKSVDWNVKKEIIEKVMEDISIVGYTDVLIEVNKLFAFADMRKVKRYLGE